MARDAFRLSICKDYDISLKSPEPKQVVSYTVACDMNLKKVMYT